MLKQVFKNFKESFLKALKLFGFHQTMDSGFMKISYIKEKIAEVEDLLKLKEDIEFSLFKKETIENCKIVLEFFVENNNLNRMFNEIEIIPEANGVVSFEFKGESFILNCSIGVSKISAYSYFLNEDKTKKYFDGNLKKFIDFLNEINFS